MFYTTYRPQKFSEICRPNEAADVLVKQIQTGKTVHAYLFVGPRGTGKTTTARILAKALNCKKVDTNGDPCGKCDVCLAIKDGMFVDLVEIDAASNRGIDDIRELKERVKLAPSIADKKVYIIDEVHMLTAEAFNALLKTLEEPPRNTIFILCTTELHKVPDTIKSRCQVFKFRRATVLQLVAKLKEITKAEKIKMSDVDLGRIAQASLGGFRDAETLLQQVSEGEIDLDSLLSISSKETYIDFVAALVGGNSNEAIQIVNKVYEEGVDLYVWVGELLKYLRDLLFIKSGAQPDLSGYTEELIENISKQTGGTNVKWLVDTLTKLVSAHKEVRISFIPQLPIEVFVVDVCCKSDSADEANKVVSERKVLKKVETKAEVKQEKPVKEEVKKEEPADEDDEDDEDDDREKPKKFELSKKKVATKSEEDGPVEDKSSNFNITLEEIQSKWDEVLMKSKPLNHSMTALLKAGKPIAITGKFLVIEVCYPFHKERLESPRNRILVEKLFEEIFAVPLNIKCQVNSENAKKSKRSEADALTDLNIKVPSGIDAKNILDVFDGGLPLLG